jgi:hypothetical protein
MSPRSADAGGDDRGADLLMPARTETLDRADNIRRLGELNKGQLQEVFERIQQFPVDLQYEGTPVVRWTGEQADALLAKWSAINE